MRKAAAVLFVVALVPFAAARAEEPPRASSASVVRTPAEKGPELLGVRGLRVHILRAGDVYDMNTRKLIPTAAESETRH